MNYVIKHTKYKQVLGVVVETGEEYDSVELSISPSYNIWVTNSYEHAVRVLNQTGDYVYGCNQTNPSHYYDPPIRI